MRANATNRQTLRLLPARVTPVRSRISSREDEFTAETGRDGTGRDEHEQIRLDSEELVHAGCTRQSEFVSSFDWSARHHYYRFRRVERSPNFRIFPRPNQIPTPFVSRSIDGRSILLAILKVRARKYAQNR